MKTKFNIKTSDGLVEVEGKIIPGTLGMKMFIHKSYKMNGYTVSEFYTGMSLTCGEGTIKSTIEDALRRERNETYWPDVNARIQDNKRTVENNLNNSGYANRDQ